MAVRVTAGQCHESTQLEATMNAVRIKSAVTGRWRRRPRRLAGDKGYSYRHLRQWLHRRKITPVIPQRSNQVGRAGGCRQFDREAYRGRNVVERCVGWLKECRRIGTRFEKLAVNFLAMLHLAMIQRYLRRLLSDTP